MEKDIQKSTQFIQRLLANPAIKDLFPLQKEQQIVQFLKLNARQLFPTLSSPNFFPEKNWNQIQALLYESLMNIINESLFPQLEEIIKKVDFGFIAFMREQGLPINNAPQIIIEFQKKILNKYSARQAFNGPMTAVIFSLTDRYIDEAFRRREYIYFELVKVQRLKMSKEEIKNLVKASLLLKNTIHLMTVSETRQGMVSEVVQLSFVEKVFNALKQQLKILPPPLLKSGLNANISFLENPKMETTSRLASIFAFRCYNYRPIDKVDRGADTPDKSWFSIARRNYKYYGFDLKMLDELYKIAGENGW
jgi:hypothetical protein